MAQILLIEGDPGSGKTALCADAVRRAAEAGFLVLSMAGVEEEAQLPMAGLSMLLRPLLAELPGPGESIPTGQLCALKIAAGLSEDVVADRFVLGVAVTSLLAEVAGSQPLLVVIDDAQWIDELSCEALSFALRRIGADPMLVLLASRPGQCRPALPEHTDRWSITGLGSLEVADMLGDAQLPVAQEVADAIVAATGGLPLAVLETARAMSATQRDGTASLPDPLPVGLRVTAAYRAQLDGLPERTRLAVALAAAAGSVPIQVVDRALGELGLERGELEAAEDIGALIVEATGVRFAHPLLRSAAMHLLTPAARRRCHRALADATAAEPGRAARHLMAACTGPDEAVALAVSRAASEVARRGGLSAAARLLVDAAAYSPAGEPRQARLVAAARALSVAGRSREAVSLANEVISATTNPATRTDAAIIIVETSTWGTATSQALDLAVREAAQIGPFDRNRALRAFAQASMGATVVGALTDALRLAQHAVDLIDEQTPDPTRAEAESVFAMILVLTGHHHRATQVLAEWSMPAVGDITAADLFAPRFPSMVQSMIRLGRYNEADALVGRLAAVWARESTPIGKSYALSVAAELRWWQGRWMQAISLCEEAISLADETGQTLLGFYVRAITARTFAAQGDNNRCRHYAEAALQAAQEHDLEPMRLYALGALGLLELTGGRPAGAVGPLLEAEQVRRRCGWRDPTAVPFGPDLIEALVRAGRVQDANEVFAAHRDIVTTSCPRWAKAALTCCQALLAEDVHEAETLFAAALELTPPEVPFEAARTCLYWGEHLRRNRKIVPSRTLLLDAFTTFNHLYARPWANRAAAELRATGTHPDIDTTPDLAALSPQELRCALAVAEGQSNREAATALFISPKTVEYHLHKVYRKLGISSRTQLTRLFATPTQTRGNQID
jgi:DNA-binding CsgD family transcriptional regulator